MRGRNRCRTNKLSEKNYHTTAPGVAFWYRITANFPSFLRKLIMSQQHTTQASGQGMLERVFKRHCCKVSDEAAFCLIQRPYISKTLLTRRISPRGSP
ncbi:hypothetical protein DRX03_21225 [Salmonella enterica subsp. enterica serovar Kentucky]|nr:hypothetical protein [Salmonella enterica subsp. enterica serovar Kentucky]